MAMQRESCQKNHSRLLLLLLLLLLAASHVCVGGC